MPGEGLAARAEGRGAESVAADLGGPSSAGFVVVGLLFGRPSVASLISPIGLISPISVISLVSLYRV